MRCGVYALFILNTNDEGFFAPQVDNGNALCELLLIVQEQHRKALAARCEHLYIKEVSDHAKAP